MERRTDIHHRVKTRRFLVGKTVMTAAGIFDDDWAEALLTLVLTLEADLLTLGAAPVEWVQ